MRVPSFAGVRPSSVYAAEHGGSLLLTASFISIMSVAVGVAYLGTTHVGRLAARTKTLQSAIAVGDAYLESAFAQWRATCRSQGNTSLTAASLNPLTSPDAKFLPEPPNFTIANYRIAVLDHDGVETANNVSPLAAQGEDPGDNTYLYRASVDVTAPTRGGRVTARVRRMFEKRVESPWKYAIFYNEVLEIHPSPTFTVNGPVHTNGKLFAAPDGGNPLTFKDRVTFANSYFQGYAPGNWTWRGRTSANGAAPTYAAGLPPAADVRKDFFGITPTQFNTGDGNKNTEGYRELIERPEAGYSDPLTNANGDNPRLYNSAQARVLVDKDNGIKILNSKNQEVSASSTGNDKLLYDAIRPALTTNESFKDQRENAFIRVVSVDINKLKTNTVPGFNGVIYISDTSAGQDGKTNKRGIRLRNGATLPVGGLTFVSDNPVYVQGNYNSSGTRQPAAVIGDAIMVMSQNWKDANSDEKKGSGKRTATNTTINAAFLAGDVPTDARFNNNTAYSGGVENFPRFMENWGNVTFTYNGSMVQLFTSKQAIGRWGNNSEAYDAPIRNWAFDTLFRTNPPPGSLFTTTYVKQRWYME